MFFLITPHPPSEACCEVHSNYSFTQSTTLGLTQERRRGTLGLSPVVGERLPALNTYLGGGGEKLGGLVGRKRSSRGACKSGSRGPSKRSPILPPVRRSARSLLLFPPHGGGREGGLLEIQVGFFLASRPAVTRQTAASAHQQGQARRPDCPERAGSLSARSPPSACPRRAHLLSLGVVAAPLAGLMPFHLYSP